MYAVVATRDSAAVEAEVRSIYFAMYPSGNSRFVAQAFSWARECFGGGGDYQPIDAKYHDMEHTMQGALCMVRLLQARHETGVQPVLTQRMFELGLLAILLHDTGYLKRKGDTEGTGAKYTVVHVTRSAEFAANFLTLQGVCPSEIKSVQNMIHCTGVDAVLKDLPFQEELERVVGFVLGTADLLGQMAAPDYVEKLPILYSEFAEAAQDDGSKGKAVSMFSSAGDLIRKTPGFWEKFVLPKLDRDFAGVYRFLNRPFPSGSNEYIEKIEANIARLRRDIANGVV